MASTSAFIASAGVLDINAPVVSSEVANVGKLNKAAPSDALMPTVIQGTFDNNATGTVTLSSSTTANGFSTNFGSFTLSAGQTFRCNGFNQGSGTLSIGIASSFISTGTFFDFGGTIAGTVTSVGSNSSVDLDATGGGTFVIANNNSTAILSSYFTSPVTISAGMAVLFQPVVSSALKVNVSSTGLLNKGTLSLVSAVGCTSSLTSNFNNSGTFTTSDSGNPSMPTSITNMTNAAGASASFNTSTTVSGGVTNVGLLNIAAGVTLSVNGSFAINGGTIKLASVQVQSPGTVALLKVGTFSFAGTSNGWIGQLDLGGGTLDVQSGDLPTITNEIKQGFNNGNWNGASGILASTAANNTAHLTAIGVVQNNQSGSQLFTASNQFDNTTPGLADILLKYTYYGDANLDGKVDGSDYTLIDSGYVTHSTGWFNGDFNYDNVVNGSDYTLIDNAFNTQGAQIAAKVANPLAITTAQIAQVPEPMMFNVLALAGAGLLGRKRFTQNKSGSCRAGL